MKKLDDKLRELKNTIPEYPDALDTRVEAFLRDDVNVPRHTFNLSLLFSSVSAFVAFVAVMVVVINNIPSVNLPLIPDGSEVPTTQTSEEPSETSETPSETPTSQTTSVSETEPISEPGSDLHIAFTSVVSQSVNFDLSEIGSEVGLSIEDISLIQSAAELSLTIARYHSDFQSVLTEGSAFVSEEDDFFARHVLLLVPFVYSSSETIEGADKIILNDDNEIELWFKLYSEESNDTDLQVSFYFLSIEHVYLNVIEESDAFVIKVFNTFNNSNTSVYYGA